MKSMKLTYPATVEGLSSASERLNDTLDTEGCPAALKAKLMVAVDEVVSNIINYSGACEFEVEIAFPRNPESVRISFSDAGKAFNPLTEAPEADTTSDLNHRAVGGLGMFMVKKMMDDVNYVYENGRNVLTVHLLRS